MDNDNQQSLALARFEALRIHQPKSWDEGAVSTFHEIVTSLEDAFGFDLSAFRVPATDMKPRRLGDSRVSYSGRFPAHRQLSVQLYCDEAVIRRHIDGIVLYFQRLQPAPEVRKIGF
jgi:hypothetical protein